MQLEWDEILAAKFKEVITEHTQTIFLEADERDKWKISQ